MDTNETLRGKENATEKGQEAQKKEENQNEVKTYTEEELQKLLQSETDKRVTEAMKTAEKKWLKKIEEEKDEAAKLAKMSEQERQQAEFEKMKSDLEAERKEFERQKQELELNKQLEEEGLSVKFSSFLLGETAEQTMQNLKNFKEVFKSEVEAATNKRLGGEAPKVGDKPIKIDIANMTHEQINEHWDAVNNYLKKQR